MDFKGLLLRAKSDDNEALTELLLMYRPLLLKESIVDGVFDEDLLGSPFSLQIAALVQCKGMYDTRLQ